MDETNINNLFNLKNNVAIITGGARGLGYDMATALAEAGANIIITSREIARAEKSAEKIRSACGVDTLALPLDHCIWEQVQSMSEKAYEWKYRIDILINNAGGGSGQGECNLFKRPVDSIINLINSNLLGPLLCCKAVGEYMVKRKYGKIINIASIAGFVARDREMYYRNEKTEQPIDYAAAKAGVIGMTKDLAGLLSPHGIYVNCISPGGFDSGNLPQSFVEDYSRETLLGRMGKMEPNFKGVAAYSASAVSDYLMGHKLLYNSSTRSKNRRSFDNSSSAPGGLSALFLYRIISSKTEKSISGKCFFNIPAACPCVAGTPNSKQTTRGNIL